MRTLSGPIRRSALFASICVLLPLAYLLLWLFDVREVFSSLVNLLFTTGAWGPVFPLVLALDRFAFFGQFYWQVIIVALAIIAWFIAAFFVHRLVRRTWAAAVIMIVLYLFFSGLNVVLLLPHLIQ